MHNSSLGSKDNTKWASVWRSIQYHSTVSIFLTPIIGIWRAHFTVCVIGSCCSEPRMRGGGLLLTLLYFSSGGCKTVASAHCLCWRGEAAAKDLVNWCSGGYTWAKIHVTANHHTKPLGLGCERSSPPKGAATTTSCLSFCTRTGESLC